MSDKPKSRTSSRSSGRGKKRTQDRAATKGTVWLPDSGRFVPVGVLLDLSERGVRYFLDPSSLDGEGFPMAAPDPAKPIMLAVTLRSGDSLVPVTAKPVRVSCGKDGRVEVACSFEASDAEEMKTLHKKYVDASLQRARDSLSLFRERNLGAAPRARRAKKDLDQILIRRRAIDRSDLAAYRAGNLDGVKLGERLVSAGLVTPRQLAQSMSEHTGVPFVDLSRIEVDAEAKRAIKPGTAKRLMVVPFQMGTRRLKVACVRLLTALERSELEAEARKKIVLHLADPEQVTTYIHGTSVRKRRRITQRVQTDVLARYRFYGSAMQAYTRQTYDGVVVNLSDTGILISGPAPETLLRDFEQEKKPRLVVAVQLFREQDSSPVLIRFEPVRIAPLAPDADLKHSVNQTVPSWIGARVSHLLEEDESNLRKMVKRLGER